jgi:glutamate formiminotransferase
VRQSFSEGTRKESVKKVDDPECTNNCQKAIAVLKDSSNSHFNKSVTVTYKLINGRWQWNVRRD